jgi:hypothetical protein
MLHINGKHDEKKLMYKSSVLDVSYLIIMVNYVPMTFFTVQNKFAWKTVFGVRNAHPSNLRRLGHGK